MAVQEVVEALITLERIAKIKGLSYVYPKKIESFDGGTCRYSTDQGDASCIVGFYFSKVDSDMFEFVKNYENENGESPGGVPDVLRAFWFTQHETGYDPITGSDYRDVSDSPLAKVLQKAQDAQDSGKTWGESVRQARTFAETMGYVAAP